MWTERMQTDSSRKHLMRQKRCWMLIREITAIMCGNDQIAVGAITALNLAERKDIIVYGIDGSPDIKKELVKKDSVVAGTVAQSPIQHG